MILDDRLQRLRVASAKENTAELVESKVTSMLSNGSMGTSGPVGTAVVMKQSR